MHSMNTFSATSVCLVECQSLRKAVNTMGGLKNTVGLLAPFTGIKMEKNMSAGLGVALYLKQLLSS